MPVSATAAVALRNPRTLKEIENELREAVEAGMAFLARATPEQKPAALKGLWKACREFNEFLNQAYGKALPF